MLAFIAFTTPLLLAGLALLSLPVVAHLLQRHARKELVFPTVAFLMEAVATQSRFHRLKRWLLLLLRLLAAACIVLAFARPMWFDASQVHAASSEQGTAVMLLVDTSVSTTQQSDGVSALEHLRAAADRALDSLQSGKDLANIVYADAAPRAAYPRMSANLPTLRAELSRLTATQTRADFANALAMAGKLLGEHQGPKRLVVLSDLQASNWAETLDDASLRQALPLGTVVSIVDAEGAVPDNVALSNPRHYPPQPLAGKTCELSVHVQNFSERSRQVRVSVDLEQNGMKSAAPEQTITLAPGESHDVLFATAAPDQGPLLATFSVPVDGFAADNRAFRVVESAARIPILLVSDDSPAEPGTAAYYLSRALAPQGDDSDRFEVRPRRSVDVTAADLAAVQGVFVGYVGELAAPLAKSLVDYVERGGGLVFFCGDGPVPHNLAALQSAAGERELLPWTPGVRREVVGRQESFHISGGRWQSRWFREFDEQSQLAIAGIRFDRIWSASAPSAAAEVLLTFNDGQPALGLRGFGKGQFLVANFGLETGASDLGKHGAFVAWMQILARSLAPDDAALNTSAPGVRYAFSQLFAADNARGNVEVLGPDGQAARANIAATPEGVRIDLPHPDRAGFYVVRSGDKSLGAAAVNLDPRESDLKRLDVGRMAERFQVQGIHTETANVSAGFEPVLNLTGRPLWGSCLVAALTAIGMELLLLGLWRK